MPEKFSYSKLDSYHQCGFKYYLHYVLKQSYFSNTIATEFGSAIHQAEEDIAKMIMAGQSIDYAAIKNKIITKFFDLKVKYQNDFDLPDKTNRTYAQKVFMYLDTEIYKLEQFLKANPTYKVIGAEVPFTITIPGFDKYEFRGSIDRVFYDSETDTYLIQDIKTWPEGKDEKDLKVPLQFVIYTLATQKLYGCREDQIKCQYYLPLCQLTQDAGDGDYIQKGIKQIAKLFEGIEAGDYTPHESPLCSWCEYCWKNEGADPRSKYLCPYYSLWDKETRNKADIHRSEYTWEGLDKHPFILELYHKKYHISDGEEVNPDGNGNQKG